MTTARLDKPRRWARRDVVGLAAALVIGAGLYAPDSTFAETAFRIPAPDIEMTGNASPSPAINSATSASRATSDASGVAVPAGAPAGLRTAVFAGGCFWGVQGVFQYT